MSTGSRSSLAGAVVALTAKAVEQYLQQPEACVVVAKATLASIPPLSGTVAQHTLVPGGRVRRRIRKRKRRSRRWNVWRRRLDGDGLIRQRRRELRPRTSVF